MTTTPTDELRNGLRTIFYPSPIYDELIPDLEVILDKAMSLFNKALEAERKCAEDKGSMHCRVKYCRYSTNSASNMNGHYSVEHPGISFKLTPKNKLSTPPKTKEES